MRNYLFTGNPLYPVQIAIGDSVIFPGLFTREAPLQTPFHRPALELLRSTFNYEFRWPVRVVVAGTIALGLLRFFPSKRIGIPRREVTLWGTAIVLFVLLHIFVIPYNTNTRFLFVPWALGTLLFGRLLLVAPRGLFLLSTLVVVVAAIGSLLEHYPLYLRHSFGDEFLPWLGGGLGVAAITGVVGGSACLLFKSAKSRRWLQRSFVLTLGIATVAGIATQHSERLDQQMWIDQRSQKYFPYAQQWEALRRLPPGRVAYAGHNLPYPLRGAVPPYNPLSIVPQNGQPGGLPPHALRRKLAKGVAASGSNVNIELESREPDRVRWRKRLLEDGYQYLVIYMPSARETRTDPKAIPREWEWARSDDMFEEVGIRRRAPSTTDFAPSLKILKIRR